MFILTLCCNGVSYINASTTCNTTVKDVAARPIRGDGIKLSADEQNESNSSSNSSKKDQKAILEEHEGLQLEESLGQENERVFFKNAGKNDVLDRISKRLAAVLRKGPKLDSDALKTDTSMDENNNLFIKKEERSSDTMLNSTFQEDKPTAGQNEFYPIGDLSFSDITISKIDTSLSDLNEEFEELNILEKELNALKDVKHDEANIKMENDFKLEKNDEFANREELDELQKDIADDISNFDREIGFIKTIPNKVRKLYVSSDSKNNDIITDLMAPVRQFSDYYSKKNPKAFENLHSGGKSTRFRVIKEKVLTNDKAVPTDKHQDCDAPVDKKPINRIRFAQKCLERCSSTNTDTCASSVYEASSSADDVLQTVAGALNQKFNKRREIRSIKKNKRRKILSRDKGRDKSLTEEICERDLLYFRKYNKPVQSKRSDNESSIENSNMLKNDNKINTLEQSGTNKEKFTSSSSCISSFTLEMPKHQKESNGKENPYRHISKWSLLMGGLVCGFIVLFARLAFWVSSEVWKEILSSEQACMQSEVLQAIEII
ncbi:hypothetical protein ENBRE01_0289 [Enteropsectra breve]|nr:hypothetical protein ENBRE01_0289 [Enteropsectra breve]